MRASLGYDRLPLLPLLMAALAAVSLAGYATAGDGLRTAGAAPLQQPREVADEVWEEGEQTGKEEMLAQRPEREQVKLEREEAQLEAASAPEAADPGEG